MSHIALIDKTVAEYRAWKLVEEQLWRNGK